MLTGTRTPDCPPLTPPAGGEVLAAGRARWLASNSYASHMPLSVNGQMGASMVRCAGRSVRH